MDRYHVNKNEALDQTLHELLFASLVSSDWLRREAQSVLIQRERVADAPRFFERWLEESLATLVASGLLARRGDQAFTVSYEVSDLASLWRHWEARSSGWIQAGAHEAELLLVETCLRALPAILRGRRSSTDVLFPKGSTELVGGVYRGNVISDYFNDALAEALAKLVEARKQRDSGAALKVLEVGAGTGATALAVLSKLGAARQSVQEYRFTDLSRTFLVDAEQRLAGLTSGFKTHRFDVETAPVEQGLPEAAYDFVIAANVLHATTSIRSSLRNIKALLRRHGVLLINELSAKSMVNHLTFGLLEGWWRYDDDALRIPGSPLLSTESWIKVLREEGFPQIVQPAAAHHELGQQILIAESDGFVRRRAVAAANRAAQIGGQSATRPVPAQSTAPSSPAATAGTAESLHSNPAHDAVRHGAAPASADVVTPQMIMDYLTDHLRESLAEVLKMPQADIRDQTSFLDYGVDSLISVRLINRINRALGLTLQTTVLFDYSTCGSLAQHIANKHHAEIQQRLTNATAREVAFTAPLAKRPSTRTAIATTSVSRGSRYRRALITGPMNIADIALSDAEPPMLEATQVCISTRAFALNFADLLCIRGIYPALPAYPFTPGMDAAGVIVAVGADVSDFKVGDEVITGISDSLGAHATLLVAEQDRLFSKPAELSFEQACVLNTSTMAIVGAFQKAALQSGESILIQSASGGVGLTAIQLARHRGAQVFATAGSRHKVEYLAQLGILHPIHYGEQDFEAEVLRLTSGRGVDVVINTLSGNAIQKGIRCLAPGGRYIELAAVGLKAAKAIDLSALGGNKSFFAINIRALHRESPDTIQGYHEEMLKLWRAGALAPPIGHVFELEQLTEAYRFLDSRQSVGKVVVTVPERDQFVAGNVPRPQAQSSAVLEGIAVIGMSGRFAQSRSLEEFWGNIAAGRNLIEHAPRWNLASRLADSRDAYCDQGSFLEGIGEFDPLFFEISGAEATYMDPQQRLFLEECWKTLEDAGYAGSLSNERACGVYVGCATSHYHTLFGKDQPAQTFWGNAQSLVPARISYYLNLFGPAIAVDTACSSSLVAVHLACQALRAREIDMALAGGVFIQCTPEFFDSCNRARMLSPRGRCHTFDARADGFVPGEGVGVIAMRRLSDALADGDHIYGVVRGSGMNQDGSTNGITAPSALAQERLERSVYERYGIDPVTIGLIEAHGTGTKLGDPIEFAALTRAFESYTDQRGFCAIGSVKTNIGHAATAAGIAGVLKVLLALKHQQIPPSLNYETRNPDIDFEASPFYISTQLTPWPAGAEGVARRAAVSSFGFSGTNVHLVLEEAPASRRTHAERPAYLVGVSARTGTQLRELVQKIVQFCEHKAERTDLGNLSYTLLTGRKHWNHRLACVARNIGELRNLLSRWLEGKSVSQISVGAHEGAIREQPSLKRYGNQCIADCEHAVSPVQYLESLAAIADLYTQGYALELKKLFDRGYRRIPLPNYPFARDIYWVDAQPARELAPSAQLHPLVQQNTSTLERQRFSSVLRATDEVLADHVVLGECVLPAVGYLEMATTAVRQSLSGRRSERLRLRNVVWVRPLKVSGAAELHVALSPQAEGRIEFQVYEQAGQGDVLHARGIAETFESAQAPIIDLTSLRVSFNETPTSVEHCYTAFVNMGIRHGPFFRGLRALSVSANRVLAELRLPECAASTARQYSLHPSMMDSALQAAIALTFATVDAGKPFLPFALQELNIYAPCAEHMWSFVRLADGVFTGSGTRVLDVDLCDSSGRVCVSFKGLASRIYGNEARVETETRTLLATSKWQNQSVRSAAPTQSVQRRILLCNMGGADPKQIEALTSGGTCVALRFEESEWTEGFERIARQVFEQVQVTLESARHSESSVLLQIIACGSRAQAFATSLSGLLKTMTLENPRALGQILLLDDASALTQALQENLSEPLDTQARYRGGVRQVRRWTQIESDSAQPIPWRADGVYLITGGMGGLGKALVAEIRAQAPYARIVLIGRSAQPADTPEVACHRVDVTDLSAVQGLIQRLLHEYGALHGIIHAAGVNRDSYLTNKTADELAAVLAPKVSGTLNLDEATRHIELDFFVLCSSGTGTFGNVGQADYATANAWLDCFAEHRNEQVNSGQRRGHTLSMIWPLWADGGMSVGRETQTMLERRLGMVLMPSAIGMKALYAGLNSGSSHLFVMQGHWEHMTRALELADQSPLARQTKVRRPSGTQQNAAGALLRMQSDLIAIAAEMLSLGAEQISLEEELSKYGFDSILLTDFANKLNQRFGTELAPTIFFEHPTLGEFARYLVETTGAKEESLSAEVESVEAAADSAPATGRFFASPAGVEHKSAQSFEDGQSMARGALAIVGMSGVFPQAENIPELWRILLEGRDCITEVPAERWSWRETAREANLEARSGAVRWGGFIDDMDGFDARFFRISPKEAELMDPQQRLMMTHAYRAIEDAGYSPKGLSGRKFGIFIGTGNTGYASLIDESEAATDSYSSTGLIPSLGPNRMSFFLNWHGPSEPVETACSSSLVAVHRAYAEIMSGNCEAALVGGVNTLVTPDAYVRYGKAGMLAPDGRCKTFSAHANGYVRGEGVGILFLKRLEDAERDGDHIYALIRGSGVNHGGRANSLTAPNAKAQADLLKSVYFQAGISPATVGYIEAHGTGTELGDPVEINGLTAAFKDLTTKEALRAAKPYCGLGSIKSNIGHLELAAGVAGIIKTVLQLQHATLVASLHCEEPNPYLPLANSPFYLVRENQPWPALQDENGAPLPRRAGVSSFGFGGTNAHVILEEYIPRAKSEPRHSRPVIVPLSARTRPQLREAVWNLLRFVEREPAQSVERIAYTLQVGRDAFEERLGLIVSSVEELRSKLESALAVWETPALAELSGVKSGSVKEAGDRASWFSTDEDLKQVVVKWLEARQFERVLNLWTGGADLDWKRAYGQSTPRRLSLPTYPFSSERFWIQSAPSESRAPVAPSTDLKVFTPIWSSDPAAPQENDCPRAKARVLVVGGAAEQQERMQRDFVHCTVLSLERDETAESIRERLRGAGGSAGEEWAHVVWFGRARASADLTLESPSDGVMQVFALAKAFVAEGYGERDLGWTFITAKSLNVLEHEAAAPADASVHGFVVSLAKEFPSWSVRLVDLESQPSWPGEDLWRLPRSTDNAYAYRRGNWFRQSLAAVEQTNNFPAPYRDGGVYVVVGGAGGLGVLWSRHVIERHRAQVYWIGRRALDASIEQQIAQLARLGPAPVYIQADASQRSQLEHAYQQIRQAHPVIHGVIHSAVGDFDRSVIDYDAATFRAILAGKIDVAVTLAEVFGRESLDFLLFFSSMASFARSGGMSAYTAGCVFKDAFAHWLSRHLRLPAKVVNWGYWTVGSGERISDAMKIRLQQEGVEAIDAAEGMLALERFLSGPLTQISVWRAAPTHELPLGSEDAEIVTVYPNEIAPMLEPVE